MNIITLEFIVGFVAAAIVGMAIHYLTKRKNQKGDLFTELGTQDVSKLQQFLEEQKVREEEQKVREVTMKEKIEQFTAVGSNINTFANTLVHGGKNQGNWGEMVLEKILENCGLRENIEYVSQKGKTNSMNGSIQRPDVIVHLPKNRDIIIDSKVSMTAWHDYCNAEQKIEKEDALQRHMDSVKAHIKSLNTKSYQNIEGINTIDSILMFLPVEPAFHVLNDKQGKNNSIFEEAIRNNIVITGPASLFMCLKTYEHQWDTLQQNKKVKEIINIATRLYDSVNAVTESLKKASTASTKTSELLDTAKTTIEKRGGLLSLAEKLRIEGRLSVKKKLDKSFEEEEIRDDA